MDFHVLVGLGSNLGDRLANMNGAITVLDRFSDVAVRQVSAFRETEPVGGPPGQGKYLNAVALLETDLGPVALLRVMQDVEAKFGRERTVHWGERTLDLDILLFDDRIIDTPELIVPHPRINTRRFVLEPLLEIAPAAVDPVTKRPFAEILADLIRSSD